MAVHQQQQQEEEETMAHHRRRRRRTCWESVNTNRPKQRQCCSGQWGAGQRFKAVKSSFKFCSQNFSEMHMNLHNVKEMLSCKRSNAPVAGVSVLVTKHLKTSESGGRGGSGEKHKTCQLEHQRVAPSMCSNMWQQVVVAVPCHLDDQG